jgi:protein TonB
VLVAILALHALLAWALLQTRGVQQVLLQTQPLVVMLLADRSAPAPGVSRASPPVPPVPPAGLPRPQPAHSALPAELVPPPAMAPAAVSAGPTAAAVAEAPAPQPTAPAVPSSQTLLAVAPPQPAAEAQQRVLPASAIQFSEPPAVVYPRLSRRNGESGRVIVRAFVDAAGGPPRSVQIAQSSGHPRLDDAALAAVLKARFKPSIEGGQALAGWALVPIDFELDAAR